LISLRSRHSLNIHRWNNKAVLSVIGKEGKDGMEDGAKE
jgi:hypothetical protein